MCLFEWQTSTFKSAARGRWIGWQLEQQLLEVLVRNTRSQVKQLLALAQGVKLGHESQI